jgi:hypothetical protein
MLQPEVGFDHRFGDAESGLNGQVDHRALCDSSLPERWPQSSVMVPSFIPVHDAGLL